MFLAVELVVCSIGHTASDWSGFIIASALVCSIATALYLWLFGKTMEYNYFSLISSFWFNETALLSGSSSGPGALSSPSNCLRRSFSKKG